MSSIDNRIVQMTFQNGGFLSGVNQTVRALNILKTALNFTGVIKPGDLNLDTSQPVSAIDKFVDKLGIIGTAAQKAFSLVSGAMSNIGNTIASTAENLSIGQVIPGFDKYAKDTKSVQTIMFATGESIEKVESELEKLMFFTDETSYSYENMVDNIGKFTSMKIPLDQSRIAMQGIALAAAAAGQGANEASRAMYNISQAMGVGSMKLMDWRSIENANMATAQLKERAIEAAKELGTLGANTDVNINNFAESLSKGWFTKDVMMKVFKDYGEFAEKVQQMVDEQGVSTSEAIARLSGTTSDFSEKAYRAAQEATTFKEALDAVRDAASTKWLQIFKLIFGNYEQAKETWTKLANDLYDVFVEPLSGVVDLLKEWHGVADGLGSWNDFMQGAKDIFDGLLGMIQTVKDAFAEIIPPITIEHFQKFSLMVRDFGAYLKETFGIEDEVAEDVTESTNKMAESYKEATKQVEIFNGILKKGARGDEVKKMQEQLMAAGYHLDNFGADGIFGPETKKALMEFQRDAGIAVDGIYGVASATSLSEALGIKEAQKDMTTLTKQLKKGSEGKEVKELQERLIKLGFKLDKYGADGIFGPETQAALKEFEKQYGLTIDGIYDSDDRFALSEALGLEEATRKLEKFNRELKIGMRGDDVKLLQERLQSLGYNIGPKGITGEFNRETRRALLHFEKDYGLSMDAIYDMQDHDKLDEVLQANAKKIKEANEKAEKTTTKSGGKAKTILETLSKGFASILSIGGQVIAMFGRIGKTLAKTFSPVLDVILAVALAFANAMQKLDDYLKTSKILETFSDNVAKFMQPVAEWVRKAADAFMIFFGLKEPVTDAEKKIHRFTEVIEYFKNVIQASGIGDALTYAFTRIKDAIATLSPYFESFKKNISDVMGDDWFTTILSYLGSVLGDFLETSGYIIEVLSEVIGFIIEKLPGAIKSIKEFWDALLFEGDSRTGKKPGFIGGIIKWFKELLGISTESDKAMKIVKNGLGPIGILTGAIADESTEGEKRVNKSLVLVKGIVAAVKKIFGAISLIFTGKMVEGSGLGDDTIKKIVKFRFTLSRIFDSIGFIFTGKVTKTLDKGFIQKATAFRTAVSNVFNFLKNVFGSIFATVAYFVSGATFKNIKISDGVKKTVDSIKKAFSNIWKTLTTFFSGKAAKGLDSGVASKAIWFRDKIIWLFNTLKNVFGGIFAAVAYFVSGATFKNLKISDGIKTVIDNVKKWFTNVWNTIYTFFSGTAVKGLDKNISSTALRVRDKAVNTFKSLKDIFGGIIGAVVYFVSGISFKNLKVGDNVKKTIDNIKKWFSNTWSSITTFFTGKVSKSLDSNTVKKIAEFRKRVFGVFNTVWKAIKGVFDFVAKFVTGISIDKQGIHISDELKKKFKGIGDWFSDIWNSIVSFFTGKTFSGINTSVNAKGNQLKDKITGIFGNLGESLKGIIASIVYFVSGVNLGDRGFSMKDGVKERIDKIRNWFSNVWKTIKTFFTGEVAEGLDKNTASKALNVRKIIEGILGSIKNTFSGLLSSVTYFVTGLQFNEQGLNLSETAKNRIDKIKKFFDQIGDSIRIMFSGDDSNKGSLSQETVNSLIKWRDNVINFFKGIADALGPIFKNIGPTLKVFISGNKGDRGLLSAENADKILGIRRGIGDFVAQLTGKGKDQRSGDSVKDGLLSSGLDIASWVLAIKFIVDKIKELKEAIKPKKDDEKGNKFEKFAQSLLKIAISVGIIATAILVLGSINVSTLIQGVLSLSVIAGIIVGVFALIKTIVSMGERSKKDSTMKIIKQIGESIYDLAKGIAILGAAIIVLGKIKVGTFINGLLKLVVVLGVTLGFLYALKAMKFEKLNIKGFWDLALGIQILVIAISTLSSMSWPSLGKGLAGLAGIMVLVGALMFVMGKFGATEIDLKGFSDLASCVLTLAATMKVIGKMSWEEWARGLLGLGIIMGTLMGTVAIIGHFGDKLKIPTLIAIFGGISAAIYIFGEVIKQLKGTDPALLYAFSISLAVALGAFVAACLIVGKGVGGGATSMLKGALGITGAIAIFVGGAAILVGGLGALEEITGMDLVGAAQRGGMILEAVANALVKFGDTLGLNLPIIAGILGASFIVGIIPGGPLAMVSGAAGIVAAIDVLIGGLTGLVAGLGALDTWTNGAFSAAIEKGGQVLESISGALAKIKSGFTKVYNEDLKEFGEAMAEVRGGIQGISQGGGIDADLEYAKTVASRLYDFFKDIKPYSLADAPGIITDYVTNASRLFGDIEAFGSAIGTLYSGIAGISQSETLDVDIDVSIEVVKKLKEKFFDVIGTSELIPNDRGIKDYNNRITTVTDQVKSFGEKIASFHDSIKGFSNTTIESDANTAVGVAGVVAKFLSDLNDKSTNIEKDKSALAKWFTGGTTSDTVFSTIGKLAKSINDSKGSFAGISSSSIESDVTAASNIALSVVDMLSALGGEGVKKTIDGGLDSFKSMSKVFTDTRFGLGGILKAFADQISTIENLPEVQDIIGGFVKLAESLAGNSEINSHFNSTGIEYSNSVLKGFKESDVSSASEATKAMLEVLKSYIKDFRTLGQNFVAGLANGVEFNAYLAEKASGYAAARMRQAVENTLRIQSPSKVAAELGKYFVEGLAVGTSNSAHEAESSASDVASSMISVAQNTLMTLYQLLNEGIGTEPTITPIVDLTNVRNAACEISSTLGGNTYTTASTSQTIVGKASLEINRAAMSSVNPETSINTLSDRFNSAIDRLNERLDTMTDDIANMKLYLDGNTLVGYVSPRVNRSLGAQATLAGRMN